MKYLKRVLTVIGIWVIVLCTTESVLAENGTSIHIYIDGKEIQTKVKPMIEDGRTLVPLRGVFERLGAQVDYNQETKQVIIKNDQTEVLLGIGRASVLVNGRLVKLDTETLLVDDYTMVPLRFVAESLGYKVKWTGEDKRIDIDALETTTIPTSTLPTVGDFESLADIIRYSTELDIYVSRDVMMDQRILEEPMEEPMEKADASNDGDASQTNVQVEGVDEGDILKTDGKNIYYVKGNVVYVIDDDPMNPSILSSIEVPDARGIISELYIHNDQLVIVGTSYTMYGYPKLLTSKLSDVETTYGTQNTSLLIYDMKTPDTPILVKDMDFEGTLKTSRLTEGNLYMVINSGLYYWEVQSYLEKAGMSWEDKQLFEYRSTPKYADNMTGKVTTIDLTEVHYFPDHIQPNYLMTVGIDLSEDTVDVDAYLGSAETVYVTSEDLFLGFTHYAYDNQVSTLVYDPHYSVNTVLYRFGLDKGGIDYVDKGSVPGSVLNQFSLDYYEDHLRIATTVSDPWSISDESSNDVYVLNDAMEIVGSLTGLAKAERIYSTRFYGDRIYMVTFRQIDPFFVIDASEPKKPKVLGDLKIPGFSTYMHILDADHVLGFGQDTDVDGDSVTTGGFKLSLFDVTDPSNPIEKKKEVIGFAGTYSEIQNTHKALMISLDKGIMGFPISIAGKTPYSISFNGAYVYDIDVNGFDFRGMVSQEGAMDKVGTNNIRRLMYIGDYLYTLSDDGMDVYGLDALDRVATLTFP